ncbi:hypothetical protein BGZ54_007078 [Gamsiella multidivaricata]|nr:hypothetical protein BGZ54_007078 [Gamsiella multidivaricata]
MTGTSQYRTQNQVEGAFTSKNLHNTPTVGLRKQESENALSKHRNLAIAAEFEESDDDGVPGASSQYHKRLPVLFHKAMSSNPENQLDAAMSFRKMLSTRQPYPIEEVIRCGVVPRLVEFLQSPRLDIQVEPALSVIGELIRSDDEDILSDASWALSYLSMGGNHKIQAVIELGICSRLVELVLRQISSSIQVPVLRTIGNIAGGDQFQTQVIIDCGTLQALHSLLSSPNIDIRRDACMAISNIAAGTASQVQSVLDADIIPPLIDILNNSDFRTRKEACWAIASVTFARNHGQISYLVTLGCIKSFIDILSCEDNKISKVVLDALKNILLCGELHKEETDGVNQFKMNIAECGGVEQIYSLRSHDNADICKRACEITIMYFAKQDENAGLTPQGGSNRTAN